MNGLAISWTDRSIIWSLGSIEFMRMNINDRMDYSGSRHRARNTAVEMKMSPFFSTIISSPYRQMPWSEAIQNLRNLGASQEEIGRFAHMGQVAGWGDIQEVMLYNGQATMF